MHLHARVTIWHPAAQHAYPYSDLVETNRKRSRLEMEFGRLDTSILNDNRYFDAVFGYAKAALEDIFIRITVANRGPDAADLHLLPTVPKPQTKRVCLKKQNQGRPVRTRIGGKNCTFQQL